MKVGLSQKGLLLSVIILLLCPSSSYANPASDSKAVPGQACPAPREPLFECVSDGIRRVVLCLDWQGKRLSLQVKTDKVNRHFELLQSRQMIGPSSSGSSSVIVSGSAVGLIRLYLDDERSEPQPSAIQVGTAEPPYICDVTTERFPRSRSLDSKIGSIAVWDLATVGVTSPSDPGLYGEKNKEEAHKIWADWPSRKKAIKPGRNESARS